MLIIKPIHTLWVAEKSGIFLPGELGIRGQFEERSSKNSNCTLDGYNEKQSSTNNMLTRTESIQLELGKCGGKW
ncbi:unnamed protein product [Calypogeia fissa]